MTPVEIGAVLYRVAIDRTQALQRGVKDRQRIAQTLARGEIPYGHRVDWIQNAAEALNEVLMKRAKEFNDSYPGDRVSVDDLLDALATLAEGYRRTGR